MNRKEKIKMAAVIILGFIIICGTIILLENASKRIYIQYLQENNLPLIKNNCTFYYNNETRSWVGVNCTCPGCYNILNDTDLDNYSEIIYGDGERRAGWPNIGTQTIKNITENEYE